MNFLYFLLTRKELYGKIIPFQCKGDPLYTFEGRLALKGKQLEMSILFDFYGDMLTDKQRELFDLYYNEDLSLSEIAENSGITRQAVRDSIKRAEKTLYELESRLKLAKKYDGAAKYGMKLKEEAEKLRRLNCEALDNTEVEKITERLFEIAGKLSQEAEDGI